MSSLLTPVIRHNKPSLTLQRPFAIDIAHQGEADPQTFADRGDAGARIFIFFVMLKCFA